MMLIIFIYIYKKKKIFFFKKYWYIIIQFNEFNYQIIWNKLNINKYIYLYWAL